MQNWILSSCYSRRQFHIKLNVKCYILREPHYIFKSVWWTENTTEHKSFIKKFSKTIYCHYRSIKCILAE